MQMKICYAKKQLKAVRTMSGTRFETHFSRGWRSLGLSQSTEIVIRLKAPAFISRKKVLRLSKNKRSGPLASQGSCPLLTIPANFSLELGEGVLSRGLKTYWVDDATTPVLRVYRRNWRTRSGVTHTSPFVWRSAS